MSVISYLVDNLLLIGWLFILIWVPFVIMSNRHIHPKALFALFLVELWERFSYYGMRALLVLYMTAQLVDRGFGFEDAKAYGIYGAYGALVYLTPILGGYFADKMIGFRKAIIWGSILMAAGQFTLFLNNQTTFFIGLALLVVGNGFFKPNISSKIGKFYGDGDPRRDGAFTIFYMGINIGAFVAPLTTTAIAVKYGWPFGFLCAGIGMVVGLLIYLWAKGQGYYEDKGLPPAEADTKTIGGISYSLFPYVMTAVLVLLAWLLIKNNDIVDVLLGIFGLGMVIYLLFVVAPRYEHDQKQKIWVIVILLMFTTVFWTFFELAGSALNLFTERNINRMVGTTEIPTGFFQAVNPFYIMVFAPIFSYMWISLAKAGKEPPAPIKFGVALLLLGSGFLILNLGKGGAADGLLPMSFLFLLYLLHTLGELALSPVGLSLVTKLAPAQIVGFLMGCWFLSSSIAHQAGKWISRATAVEAGETANALETLGKSMAVFNNVGLFAVGAGVFLLLLSPIITKWMHGTK